MKYKKIFAFIGLLASNSCLGSQKKIEVDYRDYTPLMYAVQHPFHNLTTINILLNTIKDSSCSINSQNYLGQTALMIACLNKKLPIEIIQRFLDDGANPLISAKDGSTALSYAISCENNKVEQLLLSVL